MRKVGFAKICFDLKYFMVIRGYSCNLPFTNFSYDFLFILLVKMYFFPLSEKLFCPLKSHSFFFGIHINSKIKDKK